MPILDPKKVQAEIVERTTHKIKDERDERDFNSSSARKKRAEDVARMFTDNLTPEVLRLLGTRSLRFDYVYKDAKRIEGLSAELTVWNDGLRHTHVRGSWWNHLASPRQVAAKMAEHGVLPTAVEDWLRKELPRLL